MMLENILSTMCLAIVAMACVMHLAENFDKHSPHTERAGFVLIGAGALGEAVYIWWPKIESFPFGLVMQIGMALIAVALVRGRLRCWLAQMPSMQWADRRMRRE